MDEKFQRDAEQLIKRLRDDAKLTPLRLVLKRLLVASEPMNLGDCADLVIDDVAQRDALKVLDRLGCIAVLRTDGNGVSFELFSKRQLAYVADKVDAALRSHDRS